MISVTVNHLEFFKLKIYQLKKKKKLNTENKCSSQKRCKNRKQRLVRLHDSQTDRVFLFKWMVSVQMMTRLFPLVLARLIFSIFCVLAQPSSPHPPLFILVSLCCTHRCTAALGHHSVIDSWGQHVDTVLWPCHHDCSSHAGLGQ